MKTPNEVVRRAAQRAMEIHHMTEPELARAIGCGRKAVSRIMDEETVRMTQDQWFGLCNLAGILSGW